MSEWISAIWKFRQIYFWLDSINRSDVSACRVLSVSSLGCSPLLQLLKWRLSRISLSTWFFFAQLSIYYIFHAVQFGSVLCRSVKLSQSSSFHLFLWRNTVLLGIVCIWEGSLCKPIDRIVELVHCFPVNSSNFYTQYSPFSDLCSTSLPCYNLADNILHIRNGRLYVGVFPWMCTVVCIVYMCL